MVVVGWSCVRSWGWRWVSRLGDHSVEAVVGVSRVVHSADGAIRFHKGVLALDYVAIASFVLGLLVASVGVCYSVFKFIFWISLKQKKSTFEERESSVALLRKNVGY